MLGLASFHLKDADLICRPSWNETDLEVWINVHSRVLRRRLESERRVSERLPSEVALALPFVIPPTRDPPCLPSNVTQGEFADCFIGISVADSTFLLLSDVRLESPMPSCYVLRPTPQIFSCAPNCADQTESCRSLTDGVPSPSVRLPRLVEVQT